MKSGDTLVIVAKVDPVLGMGGTRGRNLGPGHQKEGFPGEAALSWFWRVSQGSPVERKGIPDNVSRQGAEGSREAHVATTGGRAQRGGKDAAGVAGEARCVRCAGSGVLCQPLERQGAENRLPTRQSALSNF